MRRLSLLPLSLAACAVAIAADLPAPSPSPIESKLQYLEIEQIPYSSNRQDSMGFSYPFSSRPWDLCRKKKRGEVCSVQRMGHWLELAFKVDQHRIFGPQWMADSDFYLIRFQYNVEGRCPAILRSLVREILREKFSVISRHEERPTDVLVIGRRDGESPPPIPSAKTECGVETPPEYSSPSPTSAGISNLGLVADAEASRRMYPLGQPDDVPGLGVQVGYSGCTMSELAEQLGYLTKGNVFDETGIDGRYDFQATTTSPRGLASQLRDRFGVEARVESRLMDSLVVDAPKPVKKFKYESKEPVGPVACPAE